MMAKKTPGAPTPLLIEFPQFLTFKILYAEPLL